MGVRIVKKLGKPQKSSAYSLYWDFAYKRQQIFEKRLSNSQGPWSPDLVLRENRFTNVFRASDRVSQFLIALQYDTQDSKEVFFKTLLFKIFNKIETYNSLSKELGHISYQSFDLKRYDDLLTWQMAVGARIYSAAYIMPSAGRAFGYKFKHTNHLALLQKMLKDNLDKKIFESDSLESVYNLLIGYPSFGSFLAYQYAVDINYSEFLNFSENDFVVAGPGAKSGVMKCFASMGDYSYEDIIRMMVDEQDLEFERLGYQPVKLWGRSLHLIDCQNLFCEVDKYLRVIKPEFNGENGRSRIKQKFKGSKGGLSFFFPPKWNINQNIHSPCQVKANEGIFS